MQPALENLEFALPAATGLFSVALLAMLVWRRQLRAYPVFGCYCLLDSIQTVVTFLPIKLNIQARILTGVLIFQWVFYFLLILELVDRILSDHPGLARIGRRVFQFLMVAAAAGSLFVLKFDWVPNSTWGDLRLVFQIERVIAGCLLLFMLLINLFLWAFPVRLSRNTKAYCWGFSVLFLVKTIAPFLLNYVGVEALQKADTIHLSGLFLCQITWLFSLTKRGLERTPAFNRPWSAGEQEKALATLAAFEQQISRTRGR